MMANGRPERHPGTGGKGETRPAGVERRRAGDEGRQGFSTLGYTQLLEIPPVPGMRHMLPLADLTRVGLGKPRGFASGAPAS